MYTHASDAYVLVRIYNTYKIQRLHYDDEFAWRQNDAIDVTRYLIDFLNENHLAVALEKTAIF